MAADKNQGGSPGPVPSGARRPSGLSAFPPRERWQDWVEFDSKAWPRRVPREYMLIPTTCFNCESACGLLAYVDKETGEIRKFEGNPEHPGSRGRNCAKGPATLNQTTDPDRILYPLRRKGSRGGGEWEQVSWDEALDDIAARIRRAIEEGRHNEVMYHVGRPGEDGFTERLLAAWGVDGHNSHTNVCSSNGRAGFHYWMGFDRPSPDHANAKVILLISSHLETGHYFNPHAQRIVEGKESGAKLIVFDTRLSNTASRADAWLAPYPGSEPAILLAIANYLIQEQRYNREFVRRWWNWQELVSEHPDVEPTFEEFERILRELYKDYTFAFAEQESGVSAARLAEVAEMVAGAGTQLSTHTWRSAAAGNEGGWQVGRTLFLLNALMGAVAVPGGTYPNGWNKFVPRPIHMPSHPKTWNELTWPTEFPLSMNELSFLLPHFLKEGRGKLDVYFTRVYNPVWTNPDGFSWIEALTDESLVGLHVAMTPTWNETAYFADYVLPMGHSPERHDTHSYETHNAQWIGFRQPVMRAAANLSGNGNIRDTREVNPGQVWEENEFWIALTWKIDPTGELGIRPFVESKVHPGEPLTVDEYYAYIFENSVPGLPEKAAEEGLAPLDYMRRYGAFEIARGLAPLHEMEVPEEELVDVTEDSRGRVYTSAPPPATVNVVPTPAPEPDGEGRRPVGVRIDGRIYRGFPTPSGRLEFYSTTLAQWGWPEDALPGYYRSHVHRGKLDSDELVLISTFRLPVHIHTRSANAKWLDEIAHSNPLWIHPQDAEQRGLKTGDLVRVATRIGHYVVKAWVTEGIRPGVVACSHHMGRWRPFGQKGQGQLMATVDLDKSGSQWRLRRRSGPGPYESEDPDTSRIWWNDGGVHQNMTFPVQPDPVSGQHCWHQSVRVLPAEAGDAYGDVVVDTDRAHAIYKEWLGKARPAEHHSPDGSRRPFWLLRPVRPVREAFSLPEGQKH